VISRKANDGEGKASILARSKAKQIRFKAREPSGSSIDITAVPFAIVTQRETWQPTWAQ
jgi:hypothetical protein